MKNKLKSYFPMLRTRKEIMEIITENDRLKSTFENWDIEAQEKFLDICTGISGVKVLYDFMVKEILNPESTPERISELLSLLLKEKVKVLSVLPNDTTRIADETSLIITDIVVELENGSIANIEVQKIGYQFPGARCACYSSDLLLRQYKRMKSEQKRNFTYKSIKTVYTIVFFEKSPKAFHNFPKNYLHFFEQKSDTGLQMELLQKYIFIPLDIFKKNQQNKDIKNKLDAWLVFLSIDDPEMIIKLIETYPDFKPMYEQIYDICQNIEEVMGMFSKELQELDRNTVLYMIDEMQEELDEKKLQLNETKNKLNDTESRLNNTQEQLNSAQNQLSSTQNQLSSTQKKLSSTKSQLNSTKEQLKKALSRIAELEQQNT